MEKNQLIKGLLQKGQDYSQQIYLIGFFIVFIVMLVFVVRPTINMYITKNKELQDTIHLSSEYQKVISSLTALQAILESHRDDFGMLDQAIPKNILMYQLTQDVRNSFLKYTPTRSYSFPSYVIKKSDTKTESISKSELKPYKILVNVSGSYPTMRSVLEQILNQRRVKTVKTLMLSRPEGESASESAELDMKLEIEAYYL
jgi:hypothetical protein